MLQRRILPVLASIYCLGLTGCLTPAEDPSGIAKSTRALSEEEVAALPNGASLAELEQKFGPGEAQPGPRLAYRAKGQPGKYYWVHSYRSGTAGSESGVHHIVLGDRSEEGGKVVWPTKWEDLSPRSAGYYLRQLEASKDGEGAR